MFPRYISSLLALSSFNYTHPLKKYMLDYEHIYFY